MTALESPRPRRRAFWVDARFAVGLLLVVASVVGVWFVISAARQTVSVFAAAHTIVPGQVLSGDDLQPVDVALGQVGDAYLAGGALEEGLVATRTVPAGELVPQSAVGPAAASRTTSVVVHSAIDVPAVVGEGSIVEVWASALQERGYDTPRILIPDATVVSVTRDESMIGGGSAALELVIPRSEVAAVLAAVAAESALSVVPTTGAGR